MSRKVRVSAFCNTCSKTPRTIEDNLDWTSEMIDQVVYDQPDIVCLSETFDTLELGMSHPEMAQTIEGPTFTRMSAKAKEHKINLIIDFIERRGKHIYNTMAVINREGKLIGRYDKTHPTTMGIGEVEDYIIPGKVEPVIIETDVAKIGCKICFDANWPLDWFALRKAGAEIIFFSSAFSAGKLIQSMAMVFHVPIVAACHPSFATRIVDRDGDLLNYGGVYQKWVSATIDLDNPIFHLDYHFDKLEAIRRKYGKDVRIKIYQEEGWWRMWSEKPGLEIPALIKEFELVPLEDYFANCTQLQDEGRKKMREAPVPQAATVS